LSEKKVHRNLLNKIEVGLNTIHIVSFERPFYPYCCRHAKV